MKVSCLQENLADGLGIESAVFTKEAMGLIFAVHELRRMEDGSVYLFCSVRATEETLRRLGHTNVVLLGRRHFGTFEIKTFTEFDAGDKRYYRKADLATAVKLGAWSQLLLLECTGPPAQRKAKDFHLAVTIEAEEKLKRMLEAAGRSTVAEFDQLARLPLPAEEVPLAKLLDHAYRKARELGRGAYATVAVKHHSGADGRYYPRSNHPADVRQDQFVEGVLDQLE